MSSAPELAAENYHLKWASHSANLNYSVAAMYRHDRFADVMLVSSNPKCLGGPGVPAHKIILSASSKYFASVFELTPHIPTQNGLMYIVLPPELSRRAIQLLVQYIYSGESTVPQDLLNEVLIGGEILKIRGLYKGALCSITGQTRNSSPVVRAFDLSNNQNPNFQSLNQNSSSSEFILRNFEKNSSNANKSSKIQSTEQYHSKQINEPSKSTENKNRLFNLSVKKDLAIEPVFSNLDRQQKQTNIERGRTNLSEPLSVTIDNELQENVKKRKISLGSKENFQLSNTKQIDNESQDTFTSRKPSTGSIFSDCLLQIKEEPNDSYSEKSRPSSTFSIHENVSSNSKMKDFTLNDNYLVDTSNIKIRLSPTPERNNESSTNLFSDPPDEERSNFSFKEKMNYDSRDSSIITTDNNGINYKSSVSLSDANTDSRDKFSSRTFVGKRKKSETNTTIEINKNLSTTNVQSKKSKAEGVIDLACDICNIVFYSTTEWVRHMQFDHTESELAKNNEKKASEKSVKQSIKKIVKYPQRIK